MMNSGGSRSSTNEDRTDSDAKAEQSEGNKAVSKNRACQEAHREFRVSGSHPFGGQFEPVAPAGREHNMRSDCGNDADCKPNHTDPRLGRFDHFLPLTAPPPAASP